jgi:Zn-dependent peptidase ImmA (M78 family)
VRRGFKAEAEKRADSARSSLGISSLSPLDPWAYAAYLEVIILDLEDLGLTKKSAHQLLVADPGSWSAMTIKEGDAIGVIVNPSHAMTRQRNDLTHELAHVELKHVPTRVDVSPTGYLLLSDYSEDQEQEADWLAGALLLPRNALVTSRTRGQTVEQIAATYGVSPALCDWRLKMTGVDLQLRRTAR